MVTMFNQCYAGLTCNIMRHQLAATHMTFIVDTCTTSHMLSFHSPMPSRLYIPMWVSTVVKSDLWLQLLNSY